MTSPSHSAPIPVDFVLSEQTEKIADEIWQNSVPDSGQSLTVEGELIRAVEKLRYEARGNGNGNRDAGHQMLIDYIQRTLTTETLFSDEARRHIKEITEALRPDDIVELNEAPYDYLTARIVELYLAKGSQPREINPRLKR
jgi:hypothetical protein